MEHKGQGGRRLASIAAGLALALGLAACDATPEASDVYEDEAPSVEAAEEVAVDAAAEVAPEPPEVEDDAQAAPPPADADAADSVQPESETLFY
jgi:hypothetical protein